MSQNCQDAPNGPQYPGSNRPNTGVEGLMSSLISPGPAKPGQGPFPGPWLGMQDWSGGFQAGFGNIPPNDLQTANQESFHLNAGEGHSMEENAVPLAERLMNGSFGSNVGEQKSIPTSSNRDAAAENAKRLKDLRAQLLAKKTKESREPSPSLKPKPPDSNIDAKAIASPETTQKLPLKQQTLPSKAGAQAAPGPRSLASDAERSSLGSKAPPRSSQIPEKQPSFSNDAGIISDLDDLFAEVRKETSGTKPDSAPAGKKEVNGKPATLSQAVADTKSIAAVNEPRCPSPAKQRSSPELSEGEIRSDEEPAPAPKTALPPEKPDLSKEASLESEEKPRREGDLEAICRKPAPPSRDSQEKLRRQSQVDLAYSPLRKSSATSAKPGKPTLDTFAVHYKPTDPTQTPISAIQSSSRPGVTQQKPRVAEYDSYVPPYQKLSLNDRPTENEASNLGKRTAAGERVDAEDRRREQSEKEYKRTLETPGRPQPNRIISPIEITNMGRHGGELQAIKQSATAKEVPPGVALAAGDPDLKDWLELTEYNDEDYRKTRLARFRKRKELERMRLQLEEEEQIELQHRSMLRSSALGRESTPQITKMAPPSLVARDANITNGTINTTAVPADNHVAPLALKRQHAEDDTDAQNKIARLDRRRGSGPLVKETSPIFANPMPLEQRISRDDGHIGSRFRRRSRSPERYRRRSASAELRRNSMNEYAAKRTCHNCGEPGHYQTTCTFPRRDGRDRHRAPQPKPRYDGVSPNYMGKKPQQGYKDPRAGYSNVNRSIDDDDKRP